MAFSYTVLSTIIRSNSVGLKVLLATAVSMVAANIHSSPLKYCHTPFSAQRSRVSSPLKLKACLRYNKKEHMSRIGSRERPA